MSGDACCEHSLRWHHEERGCGYHGHAPEHRCPCLLPFDAALAAHDAAIRAEALREAADRLSGRAPIIVNDLPANATRREWAAAWLRGRAMAVDDVPTLARADAALRAAQPTEGES